jgi:ketosteroid isomerase-like protein
MGEKENVEVVERIWRCVNDQDLVSLENIVGDECVQEWPQSRERVRGKANMMAINRGYPGLPKATIHRTTAANDIVVCEVELDYGGTTYQAVSIYRFRDGKIVQEIDYFAEPFDAPSWRAQWVERM